MKEKVLSLFLSEHIQNLNKISEIVGISKDEVNSILIEEHYLVSPFRKFESIIKLKEASEYYLEHDISATKVAKMFKFDVQTFCKNLKALNIVVENKQNKTKFNENVFDIIDTEEKAYWLGFIYADGTISSHKEFQKSRYQFELSLSDIDHEHLDKFNKFMRHSKDNVIVGNVKLNGKVFKRCRWIVNNKHLWNTLNLIGCTPNKSLILKFPNIPHNLIRHFIRGYFDGDGSLGIYEDKFSCSMLGTPMFLEKVLENSDFSAAITKHNNSDYTYKFQMTSEKGKQFLDYLYKDSTIYLSRKYNKYLDICRLF